MILTPEENVKYYIYWVNASEAHLQPYFNCTVVGWTGIAAQLSSLAIMCWTLRMQQFFSLSLKHKPTASAQNKLRGSKHGRTPEWYVFSSSGWREGRHTIKGITHPDSSGQCATSSEASYLVPHHSHPGWVSRPSAGTFPPCQPAMSQALISTEHSRLHKQPSMCDTTSSLWEQITRCVGSKWDAWRLVSGFAQSRTELGGSDSKKRDGAVGFALRRLPWSSLGGPWPHCRYLRWPRGGS